MNVMMFFLWCLLILSPYETFNGLYIMFGSSLTGMYVDHLGDSNRRIMETYTDPFFGPHVRMLAPCLFRGGEFNHLSVAILVVLFSQQ